MTVPLRATYRIQFHKGFTFADAEGVVPYLAELGISHLYASPIFAARAGSTHGYDAIDPNRLNPELGTEAEFASLVAALRRAGMGLIIDIVPNHMVVHRANLLLQEALCLGPDAEAARIFDIDWSGRTVALPVLGGPLESVLDQIGIALDASGMLMAVYHDHAFALRPASTARLLEVAGVDASLASRWRRLEDDPRTELFTDVRLATARLAEDAALAASLARADLEELLAEQRWSLEDWRSAASKLSHRRFFNITELIGVRVDDPEVFARTHRLAIELVRKGDVDGLRIDHIDGLSDPAGYCRDLRQAIGPDAPIFVEKILGPHEVLPDWPVDGTTGYERLNEINRLFVDGEAYAELDRHLVHEGRLAPDFAARLAEAKRQVLEELFTPELDALTHHAQALGSGLSEAELRAAIATLLVHFPVYRSYVSAGWSAEDEAAWQEAIAGAGRHDGEEAAGRARRLREALDNGPEARRFITRFQQLSGPAMAKGLEDTELYRSVALTSVNEVGSEPDIPAATPAEGHDAIRRRLERDDRSLIPLATHDTKRGPDTRARINAIGIAPARWIETNRRLREAASAIREARDAPDGLDEWLIHQTLLGTWPIDESRLSQYLEKAMREAKRHTRWESPNEEYERATLTYARCLLGDVAGEPLRQTVEASARELAKPGRINGLAQTILQLTLPGVPDIYQGTELWDHSLVDPDNRRPVDFALRRNLLGEQVLPAIEEDEAGAVKLRVTAALLGLRREDPELFVGRGYEPLPEAGAAIFAFRRTSPSGTELLVAVPMRGEAARLTLPGKVTGGWDDVMREDSVEVRAEMSLPQSWPFLVLTRGRSGSAATAL